MSEPSRNVWLKGLIPVAILILGALGTFALVRSREAPATRTPEAAAPLVRVEPVELVDLRLNVISQGTVAPRTETALVPEVSGRVVEAAESFASGGFFEAGDVLLRIDPLDYRQAVVQAEAEVARARLRLASERAEAEVARREWSELGEGEAPPLTRRELQVAEAEAGLAAAESGAEQARRNLERTTIRAPYAGRVRRTHVDVGQFVNRGVQVATVYAVDFAEIRLPLPDSELAFLDLSLNYRGERGTSGPRVTIRARFAGGVHEWQGRIVRTEGEIDPLTRMVHVVARVRGPYERGGDPGRPPLAAGMFVEAEIEGRSVERVAVVPRSALRGDGRVLVVDPGERLRFREIDILRTASDTLIVQSGLDRGDRLCVSPLAVVTDGMLVRVADEAS